MKKIIVLSVILFPLYIASNSISLVLNDVYTSSSEGPDHKLQGQVEIKNSTTNDQIGHIIAPNTKVNYPVVKTKDNAYYLDHDINHKESKSGAIFMDCKNLGDGTDRNTILYGHNMKDGTMFKGLMAYKQKQFFEKNKFIYLKLNKTNILAKYEVFSVYVTDTHFNYIKKSFPSDNDYTNFLLTLKSKSLFSSKTELNKNNHILTLSTCSYEFKDARFVVHAKLLMK